MNVELTMTHVLEFAAGVALLLGLWWRFSTIIRGVRGDHAEEVKRRVLVEQRLQKLETQSGQWHENSEGLSLVRTDIALIKRDLQVGSGQFQKIHDELRAHRVEAKDQASELREAFSALSATVNKIIGHIDALKK